MASSLGRQLWKWTPLAAALALAPAPSRAAPPPPPQPTETVKPDALLAHVNKVIQWYHETEQGAQWIGRPSDSLYFDVLRDTAAQVVQDAFASAEETAKLIPAAPAAVKPGQALGNREALAKLRSDATARISQLQTEISSLAAQTQSAASGDRALLQARQGVDQAELKMEQSTLARIDNLDQFTASYAEDASAGILDQIKNLQRSVPEAFAKPDANKAQNPPTIGGTNGGLIARGEALFALVKGINGLDTLDGDTTKLLALADGLSEPLRTSMRSMVQESQALSTQNRDSENASALEDAKNEIEDLNDQLDDLSAAVLPLSKERILLRESHENLQQWKESLVTQRGSIVRDFLEHALALLFFIAVIFFGSEIARRATYKYIHEPRRRRQFLVLRRVGVGLFIALAVIFSFVSDFSSLATYVGLITAGVAVALQTVILSVFAYFMLIGRYGVRVGDRISVMGVTGEVIETGLVRFYLTELAGTGVDLHPTGRIVVFPNSALFQNTPFYKQLPGTNYTWHEAVVNLEPTADTVSVQKRLLEVVGQVYGKYKPLLEAQHGMVERLIDVRLEVPQPVAQLRYTGDGLQLVLRYPVELRHADETDGLTIFNLAEAIRSDPKLKEQVKGTPHLQTAVKV
jgi:small-conductance mechanosensitive channel